jgi:hypothetical protein
MTGCTPQFVAQIQEAVPFIVTAILLLVIVLAADNWPCAVAEVFVMLLLIWCGKPENRKAP